MYNLSNMHWKDVIRKPLLVYIFLLLFLFYVADDVFSEDQEILLATGDWAPYTSETTEGHGFFTEIVSAAFKEMGLRPRFIFAPWKRTELMVKRGEVFAAFPFIVNSDRQKNFDFSERVAFSTGLFFYCTKRITEEIPFNLLSDLKPYTIGGVLGYWYEPLFRNFQLKSHFVATERQLIMMLFSNRVDFAPFDELVGWQLIRKHYPQDVHLFKTLKQPLNRSSLHLMISRDYPNSSVLTQQFNTALERVRQQGIYQKVLEKYGVPDWVALENKNNQITN